MACYLVRRIPYTPNKKRFLVACILANKINLSTKKVKKKDLPIGNDIIGKPRRPPSLDELDGGVG